MCVAASTPDPLAAKMSLYRDSYGVPHIIGETEEATFFGYGYAQAEDHLERMMLEYRDAQGRRAEVLGFRALGDGYLHFIPYEYRWDGDYLQRLFRTKKCVVENKDKIDPGMYRILDAFARGVNDYIAAHRTEIPAWIDGVTPEDIEALERAQYMRFYSVGDALPKLTGGAEAFPDFGSNQWAIAPFKSANGNIIHVEHLHMPWANRFQKYEAHLMTPGKLNVAGVSWFGSPFFLVGFSDKITWSATWNQPNIGDVYEEKINPDSPLQYLYEGQWREIRVDHETFAIKGPRGTESVTLPLYYTHHGPIVRFDKDRHRAYSVKVPNYDGVNYSQGLYLLMKAQNLSEFQHSVSRQLMPRWNLLYSDQQNIFWVHNGNVAQRAADYDWSKPVPGWTKNTEWGPFFPFEKYPQSLNPPSGFLQNCNNPPWVVTPHSGIKPLDPASYYLQATPRADAGEESLNTRGERLTQVLSREKKFTVEEMIDLGFDTYAMPADVIVPLLQEAAAARQPLHDQRLEQAVSALAAWDRRSSKDSVAYTFLYYWAKSYRDINSSAKFGRFLSYDRRRIDIHSSEEQDLAWRALEDAVTHLETTFGKSQVPWGQVNVVVRGDVFPLDGTNTFGVLHPDEGVEQDDGRIFCNDGWAHLMVIEESEPKRVWSLLPYGESEHPASAHYNDQAKLHSQRKLKPFWFSAADILDHTESVRGDKDRLRQMLPNGH